MQKLIALAALFGLVLHTEGCASVASMGPSALGTLNPNTSSLEIHNQTDVKLTEGNFVVVKTNVVGQARGFALLGFITMFPARFETAMDRLYTKAEMQSGKAQTLGNVIMEKTSAYWILFSIPRVTVRADLVEFTPGHAAIMIPHMPMNPPIGPPQNDKPDMGRPGGGRPDGTHSL